MKVIYIDYLTKRLIFSTHSNLIPRSYDMVNINSDWFSVQGVFWYVNPKKEIIITLKEYDGAKEIGDLK